MNPPSNPAVDPRLNLKLGTLVKHKGALARVCWRHLNPNRKPGIGRVGYDIEPAAIIGGKLKFGVMLTRNVAAAALEVVS